MKCFYCDADCSKPEELERSSWRIKAGLVTVCNDCGGYKHCDKCSIIYECYDNQPCPSCLIKETP